MPESLELPEAECLALLSSGVVGRVALSTPDGPHIMPVNYSVVDGSIIVRTSPYSLLGTHGREADVAFEIDQFDYEYQHGWSVVAHCRSEAVTSPEEIEHIQAVWAPRPWASGASRSLYLKLTWSGLTGRRLGTGWNIQDTLLTRRRLATP